MAEPCKADLSTTIRETNLDEEFWIFISET